MNATLGDPARRLLEALLLRADRRASEARTPSVTPDYRVFRSAAETDAFHETLAIAQRIGAVGLVHRKHDAEHLLDKVRLADADRLATFLGVERLAARTDRLVERLRPGAEAAAPWVADLLGQAAARWSRGELAWGLGLSQEADIEDRFAILDALVRGEAENVDLRSFSARLFPERAKDASKVVERHRGGLVQMLRGVVQTDEGPELDDEEVLARFGIVRFPAPIYLSGPFQIDFAALGLAGRLPGAAPPFVPIQRDWLPGLRWTAAARPAILTIENLTSFHRHVREAVQSDVCVLYTGGFPSTAVLTALRALLDRAPAEGRLYHWGDMDRGGVRILDHIERVSGCSARPHQMNRATLEAHGRRVASSTLSFGWNLGEAAAGVAAVIAATGMMLEQEMVDPAPLM